MSNHNEPGDTKGAISAFLIIAFIMIGLPIIIGTSMGWFNLFGILGL
jgi:biotin transporter BioY